MHFVTKGLPYGRLDTTLPYEMAAPEQDLQAFPPPQPEQDQQYPEGGYQPAQKYPEDEYQPAPAQFPLQPVSLPPQTNPPGYQYVGQAGYQPITDTSTVATVVTSQPTLASVSSPPEADYTPVAIVALVLSIITTVCCGVFCFFLIYPLACTVPALILAIVALVTRGTAQKTNAAVSIGLSVAIIVATVVLVVIVGIVYAVIYSTA